MDHFVMRLSQRGGGRNAGASAGVLRAVGWSMKVLEAGSAGRVRNVKGEGEKRR